MLNCLIADAERINEMPILCSAIHNKMKILKGRISRKFYTQWQSLGLKVGTAQTLWCHHWPFYNGKPFVPQHLGHLVCLAEGLVNALRDRRLSDMDSSSHIDSKNVWPLLCDTRSHSAAMLPAVSKSDHQPTLRSAQVCPSCCTRSSSKPESPGPQTYSRRS